MIRWPRAAVSSSVQSGRICGSKAVIHVPSVTEGVLDSAERGGYGTRCNASRPGKSTSSPDRRLDAQLIAVGNVAVAWTNESAGERISSRHQHGSRTRQIAPFP